MLIIIRKMVIVKMITFTPSQDEILKVKEFNLNCKRCATEHFIVTDFHLI